MTTEQGAEMSWCEKNHYDNGHHHHNNHTHNIAMTFLSLVPPGSVAASRTARARATTAAGTARKRGRKGERKSPRWLFWSVRAYPGPRGPNGQGEGRYRRRYLARSGPERKHSSKTRSGELPVWTGPTALTSCHTFGSAPSELNPRLWRKLVGIRVESFLRVSR